MRLTAFTVLLVATLALALFGGCSDDLHAVSIDLRTDLAPLTEFSRVRVEVFRPATATGELVDSATVSVDGRENYVDGVRVFELTDLPTGEYLLRTTLLDEDRSEVTTRDVTATLRADLAVTVLITRSCTGIVCPGPDDDAEQTTCLGGSCVSPSCGAETPELCGPAQCMTDAECSASVACAEGRCSDGVCIAAPAAGGCVVGQRCDLALGCVEDVPPDTGAPDTGIPQTDAGFDTGATCVPATETCDGADEDCDGRIDEDFDLTTAARCGACGNACTVGWACEAGSCERPPGPPGGAADQYLVGDWDGDGDDDLAVRFAECVWMDVDDDGLHDIRQCYGNPGDLYLVGDWNGDGRDNLGLLRVDCLLMDDDFDGMADGSPYCFGNPTDSYYAGDWDGDGDDDLAVERGECLLMDTNRSGGMAETTHCLGNPTDRYLIGDWSGDGDDEQAVLRDECLLIDENRNGAAERTTCFGNPGDVYLIGDWDGDGDDDIGLLRTGGCVLLDLDDAGGAAEGMRCLGNGL